MESEFLDFWVMDPRRSDRSVAAPVSGKATVKNSTHHKAKGNHGRTVQPPHSSMNGRHSERPLRRNLPSGWFCGGAAVVGGLGAE